MIAEWECATSEPTVEVCEPRGQTTFIAALDEVGIPIHKWETVHVRTVPQGNFEKREFEDRGFSSAYRQRWCEGGHVSIRYYGGDMVKRTVTQAWSCRGGGCAYIATTEGPWVPGEW